MKQFCAICALVASASLVGCAESGKAFAEARDAGRGGVAQVKNLAQEMFGKFTGGQCNAGDSPDKYIVHGDQSITCAQHASMEKMRAEADTLKKLRAWCSKDQNKWYNNVHNVPNVSQTYVDCRTMTLYHPGGYGQRSEVRPL